MNVKSSAVLCLLSVFLAACTKAPTPTLAVSARTSPPVRYGIPKLAPGQLWVSSVPVGLEVHSGATAFSEKVLGRTPVVLNRRDLDRSVTVTIQKEQFGGELPYQTRLIDFSARLTHSNVWHGENDKGEKVEEDRSRALTYDVSVPGKDTIIALFQTPDQTPAELGRLYPPGSNFRFSDLALRERLVQKGVPLDSISSGIRLLHRGGKVVFPGAKGWEGPVIAEVTSDDRVELLDPPVNPAK